MKAQRRQGHAENHDGRFCDEPTCEVCFLFPYKGETREAFHARLVARYSYLGESYEGYLARYAKEE